LSENVIIQEGGKGARMPNVDHILTEDKDTGELIPWVPESERKSGIKYISKNGTFMASDDKLHSWSKVNVGVIGGKAGTSAPSEDRDGRQVPTGEGKEYIVPAGIGHSVEGYDDYQGGDYTVNVVSGIATDPETGMDKEGMPVLRYPISFPTSEYPYYAIFKIESEKVSSLSAMRIIGAEFTSWVYMYYDEEMTQEPTFKVSQTRYIEYKSKVPFKYSIKTISIMLSEEELPIVSSGFYSGDYEVIHDFSVRAELDLPDHMYWKASNSDTLYGTYIVPNDEDKYAYTKKLLNSRYRVNTRRHYYVIPPEIRKRESSDISIGGTSGIIIDQSDERYGAALAYVSTAYNPLRGKNSFVRYDGTILSNWEIDLGESKDIFSSEVPNLKTISCNTRTKLIFSTIRKDGTLLDEPIEDKKELDEYKVILLT